MIFLIQIIIFHFLPLNLMDPIYIKTESIPVMAALTTPDHQNYLVYTFSPTASRLRLLLLLLQALLNPHRVLIQAADLQLNLLEVIDTDGVSGVLHVFLSLGSFERKQGVMLELGVLCVVVVVAALLLLVEGEGVDERLLLPLQILHHVQAK